MKVHQIIVTQCMLLMFATVNSQNDTPADTTTRIFEKVEKEAAFKGGVQEWRRFLEKNLNPNTPVDHGAPTGYYNVMVQFVVNKDGNVSDIKQLTNLGYGMEQEVVRLYEDPAPGSLPRRMENLLMLTGSSR